MRRLIWSLGVARPDLAFSGFANGTTWFLFGATLMGAMASKSGLAKRIAYEVMLRVGTTYPRILLGLILIVAPLDGMSSAIGATPAQLCLVWALFSLGAGGQVVLRWRRASRLIVAEEAAPAGHFGSELRRLLPRTYLAWALAAAAAIAVCLTAILFSRPA